MKKLLAVLIFAAFSTAFAGPMYQVSVDTTSIASGTDGFLAFNFSPGLFDTQAAWASILLFAPAGSLTEPGTITGVVTGNLNPGPLTLFNTDANNDYFVPFHFDLTGITFVLSFAGPGADSPSGATSGSTFSFGLFDGDENPLATNDPNGYAFTIDLNPDGTTTPTLFAGGVDGEPPVTTLGAVPEPATGLLLAGALAALLRLRRRMR